VKFIHLQAKFIHLQVKFIHLQVKIIHLQLNFRRPFAKEISALLS